MRSNLTIGHVDLRNNRINNVGAKYVADLLAANTTAGGQELLEAWHAAEITHLDLSWNDLGADGGLALLEGPQKAIPCYF